ncbi:hypothetical protein SOV_17060 [Sporomusa ovata DSM 2662]|uniref:Uncharacterized protein n=1 Tax=Sporomusa ovata TaxID=2378 RepID=A0A0U1KV80_9FIRM|nr:hypothetical protein SOV_1c10390 [Sporomusa ovata DSM 2662]CQR71347.1 hypothetical protein SpAn4DRAFT_3852 [Sporomusa ovata]
MLSNEQIAHDLAVAAASVMFKNTIEKQPDLSEDRALAQMVYYYKKTLTTLQPLCDEEL